jgi:predicted CoA-binding protein
MRTTANEIEAFFSSGAYAVIGVSADRKKFGNIVYRMMKEKQFTVYPVNPKLGTVEGDRCYASIADLPPDVKSIITVVPPQVTEEVVGESIKKGVTGCWIQPGSDSVAAVDNAKAAGLIVIHHQCILMFLEPMESFHALHRWLKKLFGTYPK